MCINVFIFSKDDQIETDAISSGYSNVETTQAACPMWSRNAAGIEQFVGDNRDHEDGKSE